MSGEDAIIRGERAKVLLEDPLVVETFAAMEAAIIQRWRRDAPYDPNEPTTPETRESLWLLLQTMEDFRTLFQAYIRTGQMAVAARDKRDNARKSTTEP